MRSTTSDAGAAAVTPPDAGAVNAPSQGSEATRAVTWALRIGKRELVIAAKCVAGRGSDTDLQLRDESVSRRHAVFRSSARGPFVEDLDSRNGTFVNGIPVAGCVRLSLGDHVALGDCVLELVIATPAGDREPDTRPMSRDLAGVSVSSLAALSPRERGVFPMLASGLSQREIADRLGVSVKTVETYRMRIRQKLGLTTRADIVRFALEAGVLRPADAASSEP